MRLGMVVATCALGILPLVIPSGASAQGPGAAPGGAVDEQAMLRMMHRGARNQLGVLQYCQANGSVSADVVILQRQMLAALLNALPPTQVDGLDQAEATGKRGVVQVGDREVTLADAAKSQNTTPAALCRQIATMVQSQAAQMSQAPR